MKFPVQYDPVRWMVVDADGKHIATTRDYGEEIASALNAQLSHTEQKIDTPEKVEAALRAIDAAPSSSAALDADEVREVADEYMERMDFAERELARIQAAFGVSTNDAVVM